MLEGGGELAPLAFLKDVESFSSVLEENVASTYPANTLNVCRVPQCISGNSNSQILTVKRYNGVGGYRIFTGWISGRQCRTLRAHQHTRNGNIVAPQ